jgi:hypothetical protein
MSTIPDPATTKWVPLQGRGGGMSYRGQYVGGQTYYDGDAAIGTDGILYICIKDGTTTPPDAWPGATGPAGPAGMGSDLRYDGSWVPGSYTDGDIVIGADGISYICVKPTSAAPVPWATGVPPGKPTYGTTLPASPVIKEAEPHETTQHINGASDTMLAQQVHTNGNSSVDHQPWLV